MSGIYIPGKKIPVHCGRCSVKLDPENRQCVADGHVFEETLGKLTVRRDTNCPLVSVPPHGRLGDLDELKERVTKHLYASNHGSMAEAYFSVLIDLIDTAPTIIPAEKEATTK